jgi:Tol biopolymer transport system component
MTVARKTIVYVAALVIVLVVSIFVLARTGLLSSFTQWLNPTRSTLVAYVSNQDETNPNDCLPDCNFEIYTLDVDDLAATRLTENNTWDTGPVWSPDGKQIAFVSLLQNQFDIFVMNADGTGQRRLTDNEVDDWAIDWSPDGTRLAYTSEHDGIASVNVVASDGGTPVNLTDDQAWDMFPVWSPDGTTIAFISTRGDETSVLTKVTSAGLNGDYSVGYLGQPASAFGFDSIVDIFVVNADGSNLVRLTDNEVNEDSLAWSPDGKQIAFGVFNGQMRSIRVMNADGSNEHTVTQDIAWSVAPAWSPDGSRIAFYSYQDSIGQTFVVNADGSNLTEVLSDLTGITGRPSWGPDSRRLVISADRGENTDLLELDLQTGDVRQLTTSPEYESLPVWQP